MSRGSRRVLHDGNLEAVFDEFPQMRFHKFASIPASTTLPMPRSFLAVPSSCAHRADTIS